MSARGLAVLDWAAGAKAVRRAATSVVDALTPTKPKRPRNRDAEDELRRRREINARGAELRAANAAAFDRLMGWGPPRWIEPRAEWLKPRDRRVRW